MVRYKSPLPVISLWILFVAPLDAEQTLRYLRLSQGKWVTESVVRLQAAGKGRKYTSVTTRGKLKLTVESVYDGATRLQSARVSIQQGATVQAAKAVITGEKAHVKRQGAPTVILPAPRGVIVTSAPDWTDSVLTVKRYKTNGKKTQTFRGLWIHPTRKPLSLRFKLTRQGVDVVTHDGKSVKLSRLQLELRGGSRYLVWRSPDGNLVRLISAKSRRGGISLAGWEQATQHLSGDPRFDVVIRGGQIIDGTGRPAIQGDLAIRDGQIVALGRLTGRAQRIINAAGLIVCPGFIDLHSHADRGILQFRSAENYVRQGATTLVCGNCGSSPVDVGKFYASLESGGAGVNIATLIGHGSVRQRVIGRLNVPPSQRQLQQMRQLVRQAMQDGAVGLSTSLRYGPGAYARTEEIVQLTREIKKFGGFYATHMRDEGTRILAAIDESLLIGRQAGVPVHISHHKISSASVFGLTRLTLMRIDQARQSGLDVTLDQYPYGAGSGGAGLYVPQSSLSGGIAAYRDRISNRRQRAAIIAGVENLLKRKIYRASQDPEKTSHTATALSRIQIARAKHDSQLEGKTLVQILRGRSKPVTLRNGAELLVELVAQGVRVINHTLDATPGGDVDRVMLYPQTCIASDGGVFKFGTGNPHPRSYGCFPRVLGHYVRKRKLLKLETAIHKMTQLPARRLRQNNRGVLRRGAFADVVVFDPATVADRATFLKPHQHSVGIKHVLVHGQPVLLNGKMTGKLPGRPVKRGQ